MQLIKVAITKRDKIQDMNYRGESIMSKRHYHFCNWKNYNNALVYRGSFISKTTHVFWKCFWNKI